MGFGVGEELRGANSEVYEGQECYGVASEERTSLSYKHQCVL